MNGSNRILVTDHGAHPPEKWAMATADHLIHLAPNADGAKRLAALQLEAKIAALLVPHHTKVQTVERDALKTKGDVHLATPLDPSQHIADAQAAIIAAAKGTPFEGQFATPEAAQFIGTVLAQHFATAMHIERSWHADRSGTPAAIAWKTQRHPGVAA